MSGKKFLTLESLMDEVEKVMLSDDELSNNTNVIDIVQLPPIHVDELTDEENLDENELEEDIHLDTAGELELHLHTSCDDSNETKTKKRKHSDKNIEKVSPCWKKVNPNYSKTYPSVDINKSKNDVINQVNGKTPVEVFELFFDENLMNMIVEETKIYASQKNLHNFDVTIDCLRNIIGIFIYTGYNSLPQEKLYWCEDEDIDRTIVRKCMARNRYFEIKRNIHFNNNDKISKDSPDRIFKIRPLIEHLNKNFQRFGIFSDKISIDEQMVRYYGHHYMKQCILGKPIRFGLKQWIMACGRTGYCFKMNVYEGKMEKVKNDDFSSLNKVGENVVLSMTNVFEEFSSHEIYIDSFFTSYNLLTKLSKKGIRCTGTARYNRMGFSKTKKNNLKSDFEMKREKRGFCDYRFDVNNKLLAVTWKDNNVVKIMSNHEKVEPFSKVKRYCRKEKKHVDVSQPNLISNYNKYMGGVDTLDWNVQKYRIKIRGKKWYFPLFTNAIDVAIYNAYVIYCFCNENMPFLDFKRIIAKHYLNLDSLSNPKNMGRPSNTIRRSITANKTGPGHIIERTDDGKQRRCAVCKKNARKQCRRCNVGIHVHCFEKYHT